MGHPQKRLQGRWDLLMNPNQYRGADAGSPGLRGQRDLPTTFHAQLLHDGTRPVLPAGATPFRASSSRRRLSPGGEELGEQLVYALGLVVLYPVRCVWQAHNTLEVRDVGRIRFGQLGAEVAVALSPDD
jgi:hypothetical protein